MSTLRDIRLRGDFRAASFALYQSIKRSPDLTLQGFQHQLAIAIGARSLEALLAQMGKQEAEQPGIKNASDDLYWKKARQEWVVAVCQIQGATRYLHGTVDRFDGYRSYPDCDLLVMQRCEADVLLPILPKPDTAENPMVTLVPLSKALPELFRYMQIGDVGELMDAMATDQGDQEGEPSLMCFDLERDVWAEEVSQGNVQSGYYAWLISQLEQWRDDKAPR